MSVAYTFSPLSGARTHLEPGCFSLLLRDVPVHDNLGAVVEAFLRMVDRALEIALHVVPSPSLTGASEHSQPPHPSPQSLV